jgi:hypothetical protein
MVQLVDGQCYMDFFEVESDVMDQSGLIYSAIETTLLASSYSGFIVIVGRQPNASSENTPN